MNGILDENYFVGGWNTVFFMTLMVSAGYTYYMVHTDSKGMWRWGDLFTHHPYRILLGFAMVCFGVAVRIGSWTPWRGMLAGGHIQAAETWASYAPVWTAFGGSICLAGITLIMWEPLEKRFNRYLIAPMVIASGAVFYLTGVALTWLISTMG